MRTLTADPRLKQQYAKLHLALLHPFEIVCDNQEVVHTCNTSPSSQRPSSHRSSYLTLGGRLQAPEGARPSHLVAAVPHQRAVVAHRRPPPHRRRHPAACLTRKPCSTCCSRPWLKCGSQRSTGKAATVHRRTRRAMLRRLRTFPNSCFCAQRTQRRTKPFTAVSSSHRPLQTEPKWRNWTGSCVDGQVWLSRFFELRGQNRPQPRDPFLRTENPTDYHHYFPCPHSSFEVPS